MFRELRTLTDTTIGETLKELRQFRGLTIRELSARTKLSESVISKYERGKRVPTLSSFVALIRALDAEIFFAKR